MNNDWKWIQDMIEELTRRLPKPSDVLGNLKEQ